MAGVAGPGVAWSTGVLGVLGILETSSPWPAHVPATACLGSQSKVNTAGLDPSAMSPTLCFLSVNILSMILYE